MTHANGNWMNADQREAACDEAKAAIKRWPLELCDHADGVSCHFCIARFRGTYWEFWSDTYQGGSWCSAGTVYVGRDVAESKLKELTDV